MTSATPKVLHPVYQGSPWAVAITRYRCYLKTSSLRFPISIFVVNVDVLALA
ncbi:MAG: hypothetical protein V7K68_09335 [Nostoc sp.]|uniref:hypothetical protein n=1 Tax=Nostoc sp. TaxID=1180 RepID=UPI002FF6D8EB